MYRYWTEQKDRDRPSQILYYHQVAPGPLFLYLSRNAETRCFLHPALEEIKAYDQKNESDYFNTILAYCNHLFQKNETSQALHIHRNTLNYRLDKIGELFGLDLEDYQTVLNLMLSAEMLRFYD